MKKTARFLIPGWLLLLSAVPSSARQTDYLQECWNKQAKLEKGKYLSLSYQEKRNEFYHSPEPWQQLQQTGKGTIWYNADCFLKRDTLISGNRTYYSKTQFNKTGRLYMDYGKKNLVAVTQGIFLDQTCETANYTPVALLNYFLSQKIPADKESNMEFSVYTTRINKTIVKLYIRKSDYLLDKITTLQDDALLGDIVTSFTYSDYTNKASSFYPATIQIQKMNGKLTDEVNILSATLISTAPVLLEKPAHDTLAEDIAIKTETVVEKYSDNIHFINVMPAGIKVMVVTFRDFLLVAEAPLNSSNGELIIGEAQKLAPGKPIKYFTFGHHHPHYLGGIRPFIQKGAIVLSAKVDKEYITYLANAPHTQNPDSLQQQPRSLRLEEVGDSSLITDGNYEMKIYFIGEKSGHTKDYLIYYFPQEKMLFEGDLVWIEKNGNLKKAGGTQVGLYHAIKDLGLPVKTIVQAWGIGFDGYKTTIPFEDLEQSITAP